MPTDIVLASLDQGTLFEVLREDYGFLTMELVEDTGVYAKPHLRRCRPKTFAFPAPVEGQIARRIIRSIKVSE